MLDAFDIVAFVATADVTRAKEFYGGTLGLKLTHEDDYAAVFDAHGTMLRVTILSSHKPLQHTVLGWRVPDIHAAAAELLKAGVTFEKYPFLEQDETGIWIAPGGAAKVAWFKDPDGNVLSISQH